MSNDLTRQAITLALSGDWKKAIEVNLQILKDDKTDTDALNRLGRAYGETGNLKKAKESYKKVLEIDPSDMIAVKALIKCKNMRKNSHPSDRIETCAGMFLEEPGKTKIITLVHPGSEDNLALLDCGDEVFLTTYSHRVTVTNNSGKYLGKIPDDLAARLRTLVKGGNKYKILIKSIENKTISVFIKETERGRDFINTSSFPTEKIDYISYAPPELISSEKPLMSNAEDDY